jgi:hypothetical protein
MKQQVFAVVFVVMLLGCLGCGDKTTNNGGGGDTQAPTTTSVNSTGSTYLPLAAKNKWTFSDGSYLVDDGALTEVCCGTGPGGWIPFPVPPEDLVYYNSAGNYVFDMVVVKATVPAGANGFVGDPAIWMVGFSNLGPIQLTGLPLALAGANATFTIPGLPLIVNESPQYGEIFQSQGAVSMSQIVAVNGIQPYGTNEQLIHVAQIQIAAPPLAVGPMASLAVYAGGTYSLALGVGFTRFPSPNGGTLTLSSYTVSNP